jgi:hypothetical protein
MTAELTHFSNVGPGTAPELTFPSCARRDMLKALTTSESLNTEYLFCKSARRVCRCCVDGATVGFEGLAPKALPGLKSSLSLLFLDACLRSNACVGVPGREWGDLPPSSLVSREGPELSADLGLSGLLSVSKSNPSIFTNDSVTNPRWEELERADVLVRLPLDRWLNEPGVEPV